MTPATEEQIDPGRLLALLDTIGVALYARNAEGALVWANRAAEALPEPSLPEANGHVSAGQIELVDRDGRRWLGRCGSASGFVLSVALPCAQRTCELTLTRRQDQVLRLLAAGRETDAIASELGIALETTRNHIRALLRRLDAHSRLEAVVRASRAGLLDLDEISI